MTKKTESQSSTSDAETKPTPSGFQPEVAQDSGAPEEQKETAASGPADHEAATTGTHGRPEDDEDDGHS